MARLFNFLKKDSLTNRLEKIKGGDSKEREKFIEEYIPFIIKTVSNTTNRYIESENSEEYSIGLEAFNEAIDKYEASRGSFIAFAELVIKSRVTDYLRKTSKYMVAIPISQYDEEQEQQVEAQLKTEDFTEAFALKAEMKALEDRLKAFDITFADLVHEAPKHADTRLNGIRIAKYIASHAGLKDELYRKKALPGSKIVKELDVTLKMLKRSRKFIIATLLILDSNLDLLKNYIDEVEGGVVHGVQRMCDKD
ncbi:RNA polymerase sigma-I factor [Thermotalea metallivorans]|uniref:RNA polymerase sigma factor SigI n=1 Tax=Thermotalea metallivorans TaxID=520762 RepID=A0A140L509_9FIRM|nr:RNA polymerase sigma-I factor [Thermotalea metallivorans]KXG75634.1 RNA polymerase sigma factor SigI [Thermotalea metallivorans]